MLLGVLVWLYLNRCSGGLNNFYSLSPNCTAVTQFQSAALTSVFFTAEPQSYCTYTGVAFMSSCLLPTFPIGLGEL